MIQLADKAQQNADETATLPCARDAALARLSAAIQSPDGNGNALIEKADVWCVTEGMNDKDDDVGTLWWATACALTPEGRWFSEYNGPGLVPVDCLVPVLRKAGA
jgi:hypothetical protein